MEEAISLTEIGSNSSGNESTRQIFQYCQNLATNYCTFEPFKHTGGEISEPEMPNHVVTLLNWKHFVFHRGCSCNLKSIFKAGLIAGGREGRETRHTVFFTPLNHGVPKKKKKSMKPREVHFET